MKCGLQGHDEIPGTGEPVSKDLPAVLKFSLDFHFGAFSGVASAGNHAQTAENDLRKDYFEICPLLTFEIGSAGGICLRPSLPSFL